VPLGEQEINGTFDDPGTDVAPFYRGEKNHAGSFFTEL